MANTLATRLQAVETRSRNLLIQTQAIHDASAAGPLDTERVRAYLADLRHTRTLYAAIPRTPAVATKATEEWGYTGNLATDFAAVETALASTAAWIQSRSNQLWNGYGINATTLEEIIPTFTTTQTSGFRTEATALISALTTFLNRIT